MALSSCRANYLYRSARLPTFRDSMDDPLPAARLCRGDAMTADVAARSLIVQGPYIATPSSRCCKLSGAEVSSNVARRRSGVALRSRGQHAEVAASRNCVQATARLRARPRPARTS